MQSQIKDAHGIRAFFDLFGRPLGNGELQYFSSVLLGQNKYTDTRYQGVHGVFHAQYAHATRKWRRAERVAGILKLFPWIIGVGVANTVATLSVRPESDIDFFVLCKNKRVWLSRFVVTVILRLARLRPGEAKRDPVCPCFFVTVDGFDLSRIALKEGDSYLQFWLATLTPVWQVEQSFTRFFAVNRWGIDRSYPEHNARTGLLRSVFRIFDFTFFEKIAEWIQRNLLSSSVCRRANDPDTAVVINSQMLKFHQNDRRAQYHRQWQQAYER